MTNMTTAAKNDEDQEKEIALAHTPITSGTSISSSLSTSSHREAPNVDDALENDAAGSENARPRSYYYLTPKAVSRLPYYQYQGADLSLLYKHVLSPLAGWLVDAVTPHTLAPNAITLLGLAWM